MKLKTESLDAIRAQLKIRDDAAAQLGIMTVQYEQAKRQLVFAVERAVKEETELATAALRALGVDPEAGNYSIEYASGEVLIDGELTDEGGA